MWDRMMHVNATSTTNDTVYLVVFTPKMLLESLIKPLAEILLFCAPLQVSLPLVLVFTFHCRSGFSLLQ